MLDITVPAAQTNLKVSIVQDNFYARWRVQCGIVMALREDQESPPERLLQAIWRHQRLLREQLRTLDGQTVRILHPGFHNLEGGPDFRQAVIQFGDSPARQGDVEVDVLSNGWRAHGHDRNPAFENVVLHVVWESERAAAGARPLLRLCDFLDAPLGELSLWLGSESEQVFPEDTRGKCSPLLSSLPTERLLDLLRQAAFVRLRSKAALFQARARQAGWEQSLWEGLFRALGYKHNVGILQNTTPLAAGRVESLRGSSTHPLNSGRSCARWATLQGVCEQDTVSTVPCGGWHLKGAVALL